MKILNDKKRNLAKLTNTKLSCLGMLNSWYYQFGLPEQTKLVFTEEFMEKLKSVVALNKIEDSQGNSSQGEISQSLEKKSSGKSISKKVVLTES